MSSDHILCLHDEFLQKWIHKYTYRITWNVHISVLCSVPDRLVAFWGLNALLDVVVVIFMHNK